MKKLLLLVAFAVMQLSAKEYFAKVEPYEIRTVSSNVSGLVTYTDEKDEGKILGRDAYIRIDDELDRVDLEKTRIKIALLKHTIDLNNDMVANYEQIVTKKAVNYERVEKLKMRSQVEKDREFYDYTGTKNQLIGVKKELANLRVQVNDLEMRERHLVRSIADKHLSAPGYVLYALLVKEEQVVNPGTSLAQIADVSRAKLTVYLDPEDRARAKDGAVYLDGEKTSYRVTRLWNITDAKHLSSYKAEIVIDAPEQFSRLVRVEFKDE